MIQENFIQLFEDSIRDNWDLKALTDYLNKETFTYGEMGDQIARLHLLLNACGVSPGDKVALIGRNTPRWCMAYIAAITHGAVIVPILQDFNPNDVHHIVNHSDSIVLFTSDLIWDNLDEDKMPEIRAVFSLSDYRCLSENSSYSIKEYQKNWSDDFDKLYAGGFTKESLSYHKTPNDEIVLINYTSGTTGFSKGVMLTGNNLAGNALFGKNSKLHFPGSRCVSFLPLAHAYGAAFDFLTTIVSGGHIYLIGAIPSPKVLMKAFEEVRPNLICIVPLILEKIYRKQIQPKLSTPLMRLALNVPILDSKIYEKVRKTLVDVFGGEFEQVIVGGAPLNKDVEDFLLKIKFPVTIGYGMTECAPLISYSHHSEFKATSAGKILGGLMEARVISNDPVHEVGEIHVRGEHVMQGYYKNKEASDLVFSSDGWLQTGDMGTIDEDGHIFLRGRSKSMILGASGQNIYPEEIEAKLNNLPGIMESLVLERQGKLIALVYPDYDMIDTLGLTQEDLPKLLDENRTTLNAMVAPYEAISRIQLYPNEFEKTPKKSIKRYLYSNIELG